MTLHAEYIFSTQTQIMFKISPHRVMAAHTGNHLSGMGVDYVIAHRMTKLISLFVTSFTG